MNKWMNLHAFLMVLLYVIIGVEAAFTQETVSITVIDAKTELGISGANIRYNTNNAVKQTDKVGMVSLPYISNSKNDTIIFTHVSYNTIKIPQSSLSQLKTIRMEPRSQNLNQVNVSGRPFQTVTFNQINQMMPYPPMSGQVAQKIKCTESGGVLKSIIIARSLPRNNANPQTKFKLHIYDLNTKTGGPGESLIGEGIEVINERDEFIQVDFSNSPIIVPQKIFFVGVEWLIIPFNEYPRIQISSVPETLDSNNKVIPVREYDGIRERQLGEINYKAQIVKEGAKIVGKAITGKPSLDRRGKQIYKKVTSINYFYQPTLKAVPGLEAGNIWILKSNANTVAEWHPENHFIGERLAISATVSF